MQVIFSDTNLSPKFICTESFTIADLPFGVILIVDDGYQYRPDGWIGSNKNPNRPGNITTNFVVIDAIVGILVSIPIIIAGLKLLNETKDILLGEGPVDETVKAIEKIVNDFPEIIGIHDLMVHNYGPNRFVASLHAEVDGKKDIYYLHDIIDNAERRINDELNISCTIHMDPIVTDDENVTELKKFLIETMKEAGLELSIHDFRTVIGQTHTNMIFDVVLPFDHPLSEDEVKAKISQIVHEKRENCYCVITVDRG